MTGVMKPSQSSVFLHTYSYTILFFTDLELMDVVMLLNSRHKVAHIEI